MFLNRRTFNSERVHVPLGIRRLGERHDIAVLGGLGKEIFGQRRISRNRGGVPVDEDSEFGIIEPLGQLVLLHRLKSSFVFRHGHTVVDRSGLAKWQVSSAFPDQIGGIGNYLACSATDAL